MKQIALIADVHGNWPALKAVLQDAATFDVDAVWNLGDIVGYGPFPNKVVKRLRESDVVNILGNYDQKVLMFEKKRDKWKKTKAPLKLLMFEWTWNALDDDSKAFLIELPCQRQIEIERIRVLLVHGSNAAIDEVLNTHTPDKRFSELAEMTDADLILCGHSHEYFDKTVNDTRFVNPGAVGRGINGQTKASYAILTIDNSNVTVEHRLVEYDIEKVIKKLRSENLPKAFEQVYYTGENLQ